MMIDSRDPDFTFGEKRYVVVLPDGGVVDRFIIAADDKRGYMIVDACYCVDGECQIALDIHGDTIPVTVVVPGMRIEERPL